MLPVCPSATHPPASVSLQCCQGVPTQPSSRARRQRHHSTRIPATHAWNRQPLSQQGRVDRCWHTAALQSESGGVASTADLPITKSQLSRGLHAREDCKDPEFEPIPVELWSKDPVLMSG
eukprot:1159516-Pelagomonas_calceolata.AAC.12